MTVKGKNILIRLLRSQQGSNISLLIWSHLYNVGKPILGGKKSIETPARSRKDWTVSFIYLKDHFDNIYPASMDDFARKKVLKEAIESAEEKLNNNTKEYIKYQKNRCKGSSSTNARLAIENFGPSAVLEVIAKLGYYLNQSSQ